MKDIFKKYRKQKKISNIWIILMSLTLAIWINYIFIDWSDIWNTIKANILEVKSSNEISDIYWIKESNLVNIFTNEKMNDVKNLAISFSYNPANVGILLIDDSNDIITLSDEKWIQSILINYNSKKDIIPWEKLFTIETSKLIPRSEQLNIFNANFTDSSDEKYLLSTSGITF